jgi:hypothetical protein
VDLLTTYPIGNQSTVRDGTLRHAAPKYDVIQLGLIWQPRRRLPQTAVNLGTSSEWM